MIQSFSSCLRRFNIHLKVMLRFFLTNIFTKTLRTQTAFCCFIFFSHLGCHNSSLHKYLLLQNSVIPSLLLFQKFAICFNAAFKISSTPNWFTSFTFDTAFNASELEYPSAVNANTASCLLLPETLLETVCCIR